MTAYERDSTNLMGEALRSFQLMADEEQHKRETEYARRRLRRAEAGQPSDLTISQLRLLFEIHNSAVLAAQDAEKKMHEELDRL